MIHNENENQQNGPPPYECMSNVPGLNLSRNNHSTSDINDENHKENHINTHESLNMSHDYDTEDSDLEDIPFVS